MSPAVEVIRFKASQINQAQWAFSLSFSLSPRISSALEAVKVDCRCFLFSNTPLGSQDASAKVRVAIAQWAMVLGK